MSSTTTSAAAAPPAGAPMTMADWNARQRALKEQDRKSKTASAEALRNYRGVGALRGEETMLTALKEQDRKKKEETAEQMRHYRGGAGLRDEDTKLAQIRQQDRQHKQDAERILHDYRDKESDVKNPTRPEQARIIPDAVYSGGKWNPEEEIAKGAVSNIRESFGSTSNEPAAPPAAATTTTRSMARETPTPTVTSNAPPPPVVERSAKPSFGSYSNHSNNNSNSNNAAPSTIATPTKQAPAAAAPQESKVSNGYSPATTTNNTSVKRLDVKFSFGIVSLADTPSLDGYMVAVKEIVEQGLMDDAQLGSHVSWNAEFPPFVNEVEKDDSYKDQSGRSNVKRFLVKASVPIFVKSGFSSQSARRGVIAVLQQAIQSGVLLSSAAVGKF